MNRFTSSYVCVAISALLGSIALGEPTSLNSDTWVETLDCYPDGLDLHNGGMGVDPNPNGWQAWDGEADYTAYVRTCDGDPNEPPSAHSDDNVLEIMAINDPIEYADILREFSAPHEAYATGHWVFTTWVYTPGTYDGDAYFTMLSQYAQNATTSRLWALQLRFDALQDIVESEYDGDQLPLIRNQWVRLLVDIDLDSDWHKVYYGDDLLYEKAWTDGPQSRGVGLTEIAAVNFTAVSNNVPIYFDTMRLMREPPPCAGDANGDNKVNTDDFLAMLGSWGSAGAPGSNYTQPDCQTGCGPFGVADFNEDCAVNTDDYLAILGSGFDCPNTHDWQSGPCCLPDMNCVETLTAEDCDLAGGLFHGTYNTCAVIVCPLNDTCTRAAPMSIDDPAGCTLGTTEDAAVPADGIDDCFGGIINGAPLWYTVVGNGNLLRASTCNTGTAIGIDGWEMELNMAVYCGICDVLTCVGGSNVACLPPGGMAPFDFVPEVTWCSEDGTVYYIAVFGSSMLDRNTFCLSVTDEGDCGAIPPPPCWCADIGCTDTEGEETWVGTQYGTPGCYPDWDGATPVQDGYNGGYFACPSPVFGTQLFSESGASVCGSASYFISPVDESEDCRGTFSAAPYYVRDTDWYYLAVPTIDFLGGAGATITLETEFLAQVIIWDRACKPSPPASNTDDVIIRYVFETADPGGRCTTTQFNVPWLDVGTDFIISIANIDDPAIACEHAQYELSISYWPNDPPSQNCQPPGIGANEVASTSNARFSIIEGPSVQADDFRLDVPDTIDSVWFAGIDRRYDVGYDPCPNAQRVNVFDIRIWEDSNTDGCPDTLLGEWISIVTSPSNSGVDVLGYDLFFHTANLSPGLALDAGVCYYLEIVGDDPPCEFLWVGDTLSTGNSHSQSYWIKYTNTGPPLATWDPIDPANWTCDPVNDMNGHDFTWCLYSGGSPVTLDDDPCACRP